MPTRVAETVLREEVVVGTIIPTRAGTTYIRSAEPLGKPALLDCQADFPDNIVYAHLLIFTICILLREFPGTGPECQ